MDAVLLQKVQRADVSYSDLLHQATWAVSDTDSRSLVKEKYPLQGVQN